MKQRSIASAALASLLVGGMAGCGHSERTSATSAHEVPASVSVEVLAELAPSAAAALSASAAPSASAADGPGDAKSDAVVEEAIHRVSKARELPIMKPVRGRTLGRDALLVELKKKIAEEIPPHVLRDQGETFRALGLVPLEYDFEAGMMSLLQSQIAGYYDSESKTMFLLDDLSEADSEQTLNHELVHALQDQSFDLTPMMKYKPGNGEATSAAQTLIEGDATNAMWDAGGKESLDIDPDFIRTIFEAGTKFSVIGLSTPQFIRQSLVSPYADGFAFVQELHRKGGWKLVDDAFKHLPTTTEQVLHMYKFLKREPALDVPVPSVDALGAGFTTEFYDTMGELGYRLMFESEGPADEAIQSAAGWGGDRYALGVKQSGATTVFALGMHVKMDNAAAAQKFTHELNTYLAKGSGQGGCRERKDLGPIGWAASGNDVAIVAGPYTSGEKKFTAAGNCTLARTWMKEILSQK